MSNNYRIAIYLRLSRDDGNEESQSIQSQREMLIDYVQRQGWQVFEEYSDDGYSGTNFHRPDFQRMLNDIESGKINMVITKDLSRLGRNYIQVGYYTEEYFPLKGVRYIAVNDGYDSTNEDGNDFVPLRNFMNEWYAKDTSKKIRSILNQKAKNGEPRKTSVPIYGYAYNDKNERVPDSETALIVRLIYTKFIETGSVKKVAVFLTENKYPTPAYHNAIKYKVARKKILSLPEDKLYSWNVSTVREILKKDEYLGVYRTAQTKSINFKNKRRFDNKDCYVFNNRYEPLIDKETWEIANKILKRTRSGSIPMEENLFKGLVFCADCDSLMRFERRKVISKNANRIYDYRHFCANKKCSHSNSIPKHCVLTAVKLDLLDLKQTILSKEQEFLTLAKQYDSKGRVVKSDTTTELSKLARINNEIDIYIQKLFEFY